MNGIQENINALRHLLLEINTKTITSHQECTTLNNTMIKVFVKVVLSSVLLYLFLSCHPPHTKGNLDFVSICVLIVAEIVSGDGQ